MTDSSLSLCALYHHRLLAQWLTALYHATLLLPPSTSPMTDSSLSLCARITTVYWAHLWNPVPHRKETNRLFFTYFFNIYNTVYNCIVPMGFLPWEIRVALPRGQCHATQPTVHAGCFSVSIAHRPLTRTTGSLTCEQILIHATAHGSVRTPYALKVDSGRKIPCRIEESNLRQRCASPMLCQLSYIPAPLFITIMYY